MKGLCRFVCATQSSSLHAVVTLRCGAVPFDEGGARCHGCCAPQPFIASAPALLFFSLRVFFFLLHDEFVGGALVLVPASRCFALCVGCGASTWRQSVWWGVYSSFCALQLILFGHGGIGGILRLCACRACLIFCRCSLVVLVKEETSDGVGAVAPP
ncbi:hypothetical protein TcCL_ESM11596 [Trypanosoma cruzi]|nr:hypothetical protein TcCL_ESM11596 [Trypanosoma cruzi]